MGGTSTDVSLVEGAIKTATDAQIAGLPISVPMLDIHTVGAGGGSLARFDAAGVLRVGPESAGADPGPICYGRGTQPTVTDANLLLGRLQPTRFLGGDFTLDLDRTRALTQEWLKKNALALSRSKNSPPESSASVNATMEKAIRVVSIERGRDPRHFALVAFGGAGGLHACALAEALSIPHVIVPAFPGALSALGILASDVVKDYSRTVLWRAVRKDSHATLNHEFAALEKNAAKDFREESWHGKVRTSTTASTSATAARATNSISPLTKTLAADFEQEHRRRYGYTHPTREIELVTLRLRAILKSHTTHVGADAFVRPGRAKLGRPSALKAPVHIRRQETRNENLLPRRPPPRKKYSGPAIITEYSATTVIPPGKPSTSTRHAI